MDKHNQFRSRKMLSAALALSLLTGACDSSQEPTQTRRLPVALTTVASSTVINSSVYVGTLEARQRVELAPRVDGRIVKIFVTPGQSISQGTKLVELQPNQAQEDVRDREGQLIQAKSELVGAYSQVSEREAQKAEAEAMVDEARAAVVDAEARLKLAQIEYERSKALRAQDVVPQQTLDIATQERDSALAQLKANQETLNSRLQALEASKQSVAAALANIEAQKGNVISKEGAKGSTQQNLVFNFIVAPIDGVVGSFNQKKVGDVVGPGQALTTITDNRVLDLNIGIPVEYRSKLREGLPVEIINPNGKPGVQGTITYIAPLVEPETQSILTKVRFVNNGSLRDEQFVRVKVIWDTKPGILIPTTAIKSLGDQKFVYVAESGPGENSTMDLVARERPIQVGSIQGQDYQILSGVKEGERLVTSRILDMTDGKAIVDEASQEAATTEQ